MSMTGHAGHTVERTTDRTGGRSYTIAAAICAVVALFFLPIVFGPIGAVLGFVGNAKGDRAGMWVAIAAIVATFAGMALAAAMLDNA
ncbi:MAG: hypothetical protein M3394_10160 [Actinomycetota bacterium]|nr:hypothetical protein [Actinomycetota bacterium]